MATMVHAWNIRVGNKFKWNGGEYRVVSEVNEDSRIRVISPTGQEIDFHAYFRVEPVK